MVQPPHYSRLGSDTRIYYFSEVNKMTEMEVKNLEYEIERLRYENACLEKQNADIQNSHMKLYKDTKDEIRELKAEIERLRKRCGEVPCEKCDCELEIDFEALVYELQDQHQQDCIRYNDMRTAFLKAVDELALLRKQLGVNQ